MALLGDSFATRLTVLNGIIGNLTGRADTAGTADVANSVAWANVTGKPTIPTVPTYTATAPLSLSGTTFSHSSADGSLHVPETSTTHNNMVLVAGSTAGKFEWASLDRPINALSVGTSPAQRGDYIVAQYAGGGTTTTTYHRRTLANIFAALNASDITTALGYTPPTTDTNTHYEAKNIAGASATAKANAATTEANNAVYLNLVENDTVRSSHKFAGGGATKIYTDGSGNITVKTDISGKQDTISATNKIPYSYIDGTPTIPDISGKQDSNKKVTAWSATVSNDNYPSEKLVKDSLDTKQDTISSTNKIPYSYISGTPTIPSIPNLSKGTTTGTGNAVTDLSVSGHTITLTKGDTFVKKVNNTTPDSTGNVTITIPDALPAQATNAGKYLTTDGSAASWADLDLTAYIPKTGARGTLAGYATPTVNATASIAITKTSADDIVATHASPAISVANGAAGEVWLKVVSIAHAEATLTFGNQWLLPNDEIPALADNCVMTLYWNGTYGVVSMTYGSESGEGTGAAAKWLAITGGQMEGNITFKNGSQYSIGTASKKLKSLYVDELYLSQNSLYLGDTKVLGTDDSTVVVKTEPGQNLKLLTSGAEDDITVVTTGNGADISFTAGGTGSKISFNAPSIDFTGAVTVSDLTVNGTTTTVNTTDLNVKDNLIVLNNGESGAGVTKGTAGIEINRGTASRYRLIFDESDDRLKAGIVDSNGNNTTLKKVLFEGDIPDTSSFVTEQDLVDTIDAMLSDSGIGGDAPSTDGDPSAGTAPVNVTNIYNELELLSYYSGASAGNNTVAGDPTKEVRIAAHSAPDAVNSSGQNSKWDTAGLYLYGRDLLRVDGTADTGNAGCFKLQTIYNSSNTQYRLIGSPDGALNWNGHIDAGNFNASNYGLKLTKAQGTDCWSARSTTSDGDKNDIWFGIGSGGTNRGIYDVKKAGWIVYSDNNFMKSSLPFATGQISGVNGAIWIGSNSAWNNGPSMSFYANDFSTEANQGMAQIRAGSNAHRLSVKKDGVLDWSGTYFYAANSCRMGFGSVDYSFYHSDAAQAGRTIMHSGSGYAKGASLYLCAQNYATTNDKGMFNLIASDGTNTKSLSGRPNGNLSWNGNFSASTLKSTSDIRCKEDIEEISVDLSSLAPRRYTLKEDGKKHIGLIAQEVEKIAPEAVSEGVDGFKALDYNSIVALLVGEVNELKKRIAELEAKCGE